MPYIKTIKEMTDVEYVEFIGKIKEALEECDNLKKEGNSFFTEVIPSTYSDELSEEYLNDVFKRYTENTNGFERFDDFLEDTLYDDYSNYSFDAENEVFKEMLGNLDKETRIAVEVSQSYGEIDSRELLQSAGYEGLLLNAKDFLQSEYHINLTSKDFDTRELQKRLAGKSNIPDDMLTRVIKEIGEDKMQDIIDGYINRNNYGYTDDNFVICVLSSKSDVLDMLDGLAKHEGSIELTEGTLICEYLDKEVDVKDLVIHFDEIEKADIDNEYEDKYYGTANVMSAEKEQEEIISKQIEEEAEKAENFNKALEEAIKAVNYDSVVIDLYFDYQDKYSEEQITAMYEDYCDKVSNKERKETSFSEYYAEKTFANLTDMEANTIYDVLNEAKKHLEENNPEAFRYMLEEGIADNLYQYAIENTEIDCNYDIYDLLPECKIDITIATYNEQNIENASLKLISEAFENGEVAKGFEKEAVDNGLVYLLNQQGHTLEELVNPNDKYMEEAKKCIENQSFDYQAVTLLVKASGEDLINLLELKTAKQFGMEEMQSADKKIEFEAGTKVYLYDECTQDTKEFPPIEKPIVVPESMLYEVMIEDKNNSIDYVEGTYIEDKEWNSGMKLTDKEPEPMQNDISAFLEAVKEYHLEKENENEKEEVDLD